MADDKVEVLSSNFRVEDGELVLSEPEDNNDSKTNDHESNSTRKNRRKQTFERRNIKKVREDVLSEEAKVAQQAEMERRKRIQEKESSDSSRFTNIDYLLYSPGSPVNEQLLLSQLINTNQHELNSKRAKLDDFSDYSNDLHHKVDENVVAPQTALSTASESLFGTKNQRQSHSTLQSPYDIISIDDSDEEKDIIIELSDGEEENESEFETEICELQDANNLADEDGNIILNPSRNPESEPAVHLPQNIVRVIKPHQVSGVRFLYDNLVESFDQFKNEPGFGCILAHSMGLGKTIQIISFLECIFRYCDAKHVLVIVPINTIQNWQAEFELWLPSNQSSKQDDSSLHTQSISPGLKKVDSEVKTGSNCEDESTKSPLFVQPETPKLSDDVKVDQSKQSSSSSRSFKLFVVRDFVKSLEQRHQIIHGWHQEGGVLLLGYEMFRLLLNRTQKPPAGAWSSGKRSSKKKIVAIDLEKEEKHSQMLTDLRTALVDPGPQLVICDEGHRIKNSEASISKALKAIATRRRVVLTGYPLQNNLMEYWCMVDFVRPNYLGSKQEFTNMFQRPIENGQCVDSTNDDRKVMQGRAHVLHDLLSGFVQRRSHAVLTASLPPKTEVVLLVKLSPLQRRLYATFMHGLLSASPYGWSQVNTLKTYAMCCKIWNHPDILWRAMQEHKEGNDFDLDDSATSLTRSSSSRKSIVSYSNSADTNSQLELKEELREPSPRPIQPYPAFNNSLSTPQPSHQQTDSPATRAALAAAALGITATTNRSAYSHHQQPQSNNPASVFDWARDSSLWLEDGTDYAMGNIEHGGKVLLFMSLLEACVGVGDKLLLFSQSLHTLDLLERVLYRTRLPDSMLPPPGPVPLSPTSNEPSTGDQSNADDAAESVKNGEETFRSLHYRLADRKRSEPTNWTKNVHYFRLDGSTPASERERLINNFNDQSNPARLFLMSTRAGCLGVNLVGANRVVVFDASWNPCHDCQAVCRVYRYGQIKPCYIYRLVSDNTMEKKIYDRQVTKQGMSDRVVDEMNPTQQFTRSQVELLVSFEDKDMESITDESLAACQHLIDPDTVLSKVLKQHKTWVTKTPFTHESLLIDQKDRLTRVEKRLARQRYEQEKKMNQHYQQAQALQMQQMQALQLQQQQLLSAGIDPSMVDNSRFFPGSRLPNILSKSGGVSAMASYYNRGPLHYTSIQQGREALREADRLARLGMLQREFDEARRRGGYDGGMSTTEQKPSCRVSRIVASADLYFPSTTKSKTEQRKICKGEVMEVFQTVKGKFLRIPRTGDLFQVKTNPGHTITTTPQDSLPSDDSHLVDDPTDQPVSEPTASASESVTDLSSSSSALTRALVNQQHHTNVNNNKALTSHNAMPDTKQLTRSLQAHNRVNNYQPQQSTVNSSSRRRQSLPISSGSLIGESCSRPLITSNPIYHDNNTSSNYSSSSNPPLSLYTSDRKLSAPDSLSSLSSANTQQQSSLGQLPTSPLYQMSAGQPHNNLANPNNSEDSSASFSHHIQQAVAGQSKPTGLEAWLCSRCGRLPGHGCQCNIMLPPRIDNEKHLIDNYQQQSSKELNSIHPSQYMQYYDQTNSNSSNTNASQQSTTSNYFLPGIAATTADQSLQAKQHSDQSVLQLQHNAFSSSTPYVSSSSFPTVNMNHHQYDTASVAQSLRNSLLHFSNSQQQHPNASSTNNNSSAAMVPDYNNQPSMQSYFAQLAAAGYQQHPMTTANSSTSSYATDHLHQSDQRMVQQQPPHYAHNNLATHSHWPSDPTTYLQRSGDEGFSSQLLPQHLASNVRFPPPPPR